MAFATTNVQTNYVGKLNQTYGDWSGSVGDASGSIVVKGGRVYLASFTAQDGTTPIQPVVIVSTSVSGATSTITVNNNSAVTNGRFVIIHA